MSNEMHDLIKYADERGFFAELWRESWSWRFPAKQVSHSMMYTGVVKAWHWHIFQRDLWYVVSGVLKLVTYHPATGELWEQIMSPERMRVALIPPTVWHGCKVLQGPCHLIYLTDQEYNPEDEHREPHDVDPPGYDWLKGAPIT